ncbi:ATP-binding cassette domain-containing protein [Syntrophaceticus schinkii]|uniref:ATP-binding cassette domain-containing protein n=1 Tax=Syntrophaceticus schinkii TaxID=499207 RepID=UPI000699ECA3|nr:ABC transporter ATP-binding protein [Syntrophaceticus schinkii]
MKFTDYSLKMGDKVLIENLNISFNQNVINHLLGSNGVGKSCFAKSCIGMVKYSGKIEADDDIVLLGSDSNVPLDFSLKDIVKILKNKFSDKQVDELYELLKLKNVPQKLCIKKNE